MKVLMINSVCGIKSTGRICTDIAEELEKQEHEVKIAYGRETVPEKAQKYAVRIGSEWSVRKNALASRLLDAEGFSAKKETKAFIEWVKKYDPDVIHLHNIHGYYINVELLFEYLKGSGKKIIWTLHDCWAFTGHSAYCDAVHCERWQDGCYDCPQKKEYPRSYTDRSERNWQRKRSAFTGVPNMMIVIPSYWLGDLTKKSFLKDYPVEVIHNGIDVTVFKPTPSDFRERYHLNNKKIVLGVAATWDKRKGLDTFIRLAEQLPLDYQIVVVGVTKRKQKEIPKNILCIQKTNSAADLAKIYTAADVFVNPTLEDNYPTTNLEAQACGTPVITYAVGGSVDSTLKINQVDVGDIDRLLERIGDIVDEDLAIPVCLDKNEMICRYLDILNSKK